MDELINSGTVISAAEVTELYKDKPGVWMLLHPVEWDKNKKATKLKVLKYNKDKDVLRELIMEDDHWDESESLIFFFSGFDGTCKI